MSGVRAGGGAGGRAGRSSAKAEALRGGAEALGAALAPVEGVPPRVDPAGGGGGGGDGKADRDGAGGALGLAGPAALVEKEAAKVRLPRQHTPPRPPSTSNAPGRVTYSSPSRLCPSFYARRKGKTAAASTILRANGGGEGDVGGGRYDSPPCRANPHIARLQG